jgi:hypothetical protein
VDGATPQGAEPQEGNGSRSVLTGRQWRRIADWMKALKAGRQELARTGNRSQARVANGRRARASDELVRLVGGETPWRGNLGRGSRMKQAGKVWRGESRRERAKRWGRNKGLGWEPSRLVDSPH